MKTKTEFSKAYQVYTCPYTYAGIKLNKVKGQEDEIEVNIEPIISQEDFIVQNEKKINMTKKKNSKEEIIFNQRSDRREEKQNKKYGRNCRRRKSTRR